jgi:hypothetical protein
LEKVPDMAKPYLEGQSDNKKDKKGE